LVCCDVGLLVIRAVIAKRSGRIGVLPGWPARVTLLLVVLDIALRCYVVVDAFYQPDILAVMVPTLIRVYRIIPPRGSVIVARYCVRG